MPFAFHLHDYVVAIALQMQRPSRLKPACIDPLDRYGLVSKGDTSLLDHRTQENYFELIRSQYQASTSSSKTGAEDGDALATDLASLSLRGSGKSTNSTNNNGTSGKAPRTTPSAELSTILIAMRKLREAIVASTRTDDFAKEVYIFIIRTTILLRHPESYHPALLYLFHHLRPFASLSAKEKTECIGYYILDLACRQQDSAAAFRIRNLYDYRDWKVDLVLSALVHGNWESFWWAKERANEYEKRLMGWADERMAKHALQCLGKSYLSVPKAYVERCTAMYWEDLKRLEKISWTLDGETVIIKQVKRK